MYEEGKGLLESLRIIPDPRVERTKRHPLENILFIAICGVLSGAESWTEIQDFGHERRSWLSKPLDLKEGIPSHDTFGRVFSQLDSKEFQKSFLNWVRVASLKTQGQLVAIDGKTLRRSHDRSKGLGPLHLVSAWTQANQLLLGQVKTDEKSNEIEAIPRLLEMLDLKGSLVTLDAMGTQKNIAEKIQDKKADYVMALKANHGLAYEDVQSFWNDPHLADSEYQSFETTEKDHGRIEVRRYRISENIDWFADKKQWRGLTTIGMVESQRILGEEKTLQRRYYFSSLKADVRKFAQAVRGHWSIENQLHWSLDVSFNEDQCRVRIKRAAQNFALLRRIALHVLRKETMSKKSINRKRRLAAVNPDYLKTLLGNI